MSVHRLSVFAVEDSTAQVVWSSAPEGVITATAPGVPDATVEHPGGSGGVVIEGLTPGRAHRISLRVDGRVLGEVTATTLTAPPGRELVRFATINDLHLGTRSFDVADRIVERVPPAEAHPVRCAVAALADAQTWGAERIVVKGDIVHSSHTHNWALAGDLFGALSIPVDLIAGNHDRRFDSTVDCYREAERHGLTMHRDVSSIDLDGLRLVMVDSTVQTIDIGLWHPHREATCEAAAQAPGGAMMLVHHQPQSTPVPVYLPRGIPSFVANRFLRRLKQANPHVLGSSGHTHRNRHRVIAGVPWSEIGSTKDHPGVWAGYVVYEGGVRQVVRKVTSPDCAPWLERTRYAALGAWAHWSPGTLEQRCLNVSWS